jgi:hypothetical protein
MTPGAPLVLKDEEVSAAIPIGFNFTFYCNTHAVVYIGSNGFITFGINSFEGATSQFVPNSAIPNDLIAAGWHDLYPPGSGSITYQTTGSSPNRMFVVTYSNVPYCCDTNPDVSTQVILHETSNQIEIHNTRINNIRPGTQGIENSTGTLALAVPGRNNSDWTATNDAYRFQLEPPPPYTVNWQAPLGTTVSTGEVVSVLPTVSTAYFSVASNGACSDTAGVPVEVSSVNAGLDQIVCPVGSNTSLNAVYTGPPSANYCSTYAVTNIPFAPIPPGGTTLMMADDELTGLLPIGFPFTFFCKDYTSMRISSNGFITPTGTSAAFDQQTLPNVLSPNNIIAVAWRDLYPPGAQPAAGLVTYQTLGFPPNRMFVVSYLGVPQCCDMGQRVTAQVILYETTNEIEFHNGSVTLLHQSVQGIEDPTGTIAHTVPGRNNVPWNATSDAYRFTPQIFPVTYSWSPSTFLSATNIANPDVSGITSTTAYTVTLNNGFCNLTDQVTVNACGVLGVDGIGLSAKAEEDRVKLHWDAIRAHGLSHYVVERGVADSQWSAIGREKPIGSLGAMHSYDHYDNAPMAGTNRYRVSAVDLNGGVSHSKTVEVHFEAGGYLVVAPNPSHGISEFELVHLGNGEIILEVFNAAGQRVTVLSEPENPAAIRHLSADLSEMPAGIYLYRVRTGRQDLKGRILKVD